MAVAEQECRRSPEDEMRSLVFQSGKLLRPGFSDHLICVIPFGAGGITSRLKNADSIFVTGGGFVRNPLFSPGSSRPELIPNPARQIVMDDNDTFFTISYGGGIKAMKLWGPAGVRFEIRGRTIPNFYSEGVTRAEYTGGLLLSWGER